MRAQSDSSVPAARDIVAVTRPLSAERLWGSAAGGKRQAQQSARLPQKGRRRSAATHTRHSGAARRFRPPASSKALFGSNQSFSVVDGGELLCDGRGTRRLSSTTRCELRSRYYGGLELNAE